MAPYDKSFPCLVEIPTVTTMQCARPRPSAASLVQKCALAGLVQARQKGGRAKGAQAPPFEKKYH